MIHFLQADDKILETTLVLTKATEALLTGEGSRAVDSCSTVPDAPKMLVLQVQEHGRNMVFPNLCDFYANLVF